MVEVPSQSKLNSDAIINRLVALGQSVSLTKRQAELLGIMRDEDEYLIVSGSEVWVGTQRTSVAMAYLMLRYMWISEAQDGPLDEDYMMYIINERGLAALIKYENSNP